MELSEVREKYLNYFQSKSHKKIGSASLLPKEDATTLFVGSGMQPLVPYLLGDLHPEGAMLTNSQKCFRGLDIEEVGDNRHTTFFEMLGNWSLGKYFKREAIEMLFEFLTDNKVGLNINPEKLYITVFGGDLKNEIPKDEESAQIWQEQFKKKGINAEIIEIGTQEAGDKRGIKGEERIFFYSAEKNWWSRSGIPSAMPENEPGGGDTEVFFDLGASNIVENWQGKPHPNSDSGQFMEIGNAVFMEYQKKNNSFHKLPRSNVDFGGGLERLTAATQKEPDIFKIGIFSKAMEVLGGDVIYQKEKRSLRIILDHLRASIFLIADGVLPHNEGAGYVLRKLIRRAVFHMHSVLNKHKELSANLNTLIEKITMAIIAEYIDVYKNLDSKKISSIIQQEAEDFAKVLTKGMIILDNKTKNKQLSGEDAFLLVSTYGFPYELIDEITKDRGITIDKDVFKQLFTKHREISKGGLDTKFKGGLEDHKVDTIKHHTATHLLHQALRTVLGEHVEQKGSNVNSQRLRFDFSHQTKLTKEEIKKVENIVNEQIKLAIPITYKDMPKEEAIKGGAIGLFDECYGDVVRVYEIGAFSKELCGGPHVGNTKELKFFKIKKEESAASGIRRIKAVVGDTLH